MNHFGPISDNDIWLCQIFGARAALTGGVVRRKRADVERKVGLARLELEVRRRGFHMIACGSQIVIVCDKAPVRVIC